MLRVGLKNLALLIPPIRRLYEERARLGAELRAERATLREERERFTA